MHQQVTVMAADLKRRDHVALLEAGDLDRVPGLLVEIHRAEETSLPPFLGADPPPHALCPDTTIHLTDGVIHSIPFYWFRW
jgi:hypothetical protein